MRVIFYTDSGRGTTQQYADDMVMSKIEDESVKEKKSAGKTMFK